MNRLFSLSSPRRLIPLTGRNPSISSSSISVRSFLISRPAQTAFESSSLIKSQPRSLVSVNSLTPTSLTSGPHEELPLPYINEGGFSSSKPQIARDLMSVSKFTVVFAMSMIFFSGVWFVGYVYYLEKIKLNAPASLWELDKTMSQAAEWGWELENDDWTGGVAGGTSPELGWDTRRALLSAWAAITWGIKPQAVQDTDFTGEGEEHESSAFAGAFKGMIQAEKDNFHRSFGRMPDEFNQGEHAVAEMYVLLAIKQSETMPGVWFPPPLDHSIDNDLPPEVQPVSIRRPRPENTIGLVLTLRHAQVLERAIAPKALRAAKELYRRVLHVVDGVQGAETLEAQLARKIADLGKLTGVPEEESESWLRWGIHRLVGIHPTIAPIDKISEELIVSGSTAVPANSPWWKRLSILSSHNAASVEPTASLSIPNPSIDEILSLASQACLPPSRTRALLALLLSLSSLQSNPATLNQAQCTQTSVLSFLSDTLAALPVSVSAGAFAYPPQQLYHLNLKLYQALFSIHLAEVMYASRSTADEVKNREDKLELTIRWLDAAFLQASSLAFILTSPPRSTLPPTLPFLPPPPSTSSNTSENSILAATLAGVGNNTRQPGLPEEPSFQFTDNPVLRSPSSALLISSRKAAASAANLLGVLLLREPGDLTVSRLEKVRRYLEAAMAYEGKPPPLDESDLGLGGKDVIDDVEAGGVWSKYYTSWQAIRQMEKEMKEST
ncbi:hypothetical protein [Phaffia rhodozyma]|uniref:Uncharacterized protein n=1 Tax=Phaffia rhodozyma TaxID=264483 RepID=A0A0F7SLN4_PHARH|nr:hypothetical protein [Phaffia rhodozyma]